DHSLARRTPDGFRGFSPQNQAGQPNCRRQMRNARIVANKSDTALQQTREVSECQGLSHEATRRWKTRRKALKTLALGFSADQQQLEVRVLYKMAEQLHPVGFGPVFSFAAAARMQGELVESGRLGVESELRDV